MATWQWSGDIELGASGQKIATGTGDPEGVITAPVGSLYFRVDGGTNHAVYIKEGGSGNTGWTAIGASGTTITLRNNTIANSLQNILDLTNGNNITITDLGSGQLRLDGPVFKHGGSTNSNQGVLDLRAGSSISITDLGLGRIQIAALPQVSISVDGVSAASQSSLNLISGSNITITDLGSGSIQINAAAVSAPAGSTDTFTTGVLSPVIDAFDGTNTASAYRNLAKSGTLLKAVASVPARIRLYNSAANRDADLARSNMITAIPGTQHGVMADLYLDGINAALSWFLCPPADFSNADSPHSTKIYYNVSNLSTTSQAVTITLNYIAEEN